MIQLEIEGHPVPQARPKFFRRGPNVATYDPKKADKEKVRWQLKSQYKNDPIATAIKVDMTFFMYIPKATSNIKKKQMLNHVIAHAKKPDIDNLIKFYFDCMNNLIFKDDSQIIELRARKLYSQKPCTIIKLQTLENINKVFDETISRTL